VEMFKIRMQGQYGAQGDQTLRAVAREMWTQWGFRRGVMRGFWVSSARARSLLSPTLIGRGR
jgi:solute carrier family 25 carnitine/acylcarnitine transporter 20/29